MSVYRSRAWKEHEKQQTEIVRHTPGPWEVYDSDNVRGPSGNVVAHCCGYKKPTGDREKQGCRDANARLIAAAPDLLEALKAVLGGWMPPAGEPGHIDFNTALEMANTVIRKAEGLTK